MVNSPLRLTLRRVIFCFVLFLRHVHSALTFAIFFRLVFIVFTIEVFCMFALFLSYHHVIER
jgi:hypothetical protein